MVHDGHGKRKLGDIWAQLVLSAFTLVVPPLGMAAGVMYLSSPPPQSPEHQVAERADMRPELARASIRSSSDDVRWTRGRQHSHKLRSQRIPEGLKDRSKSRPPRPLPT